jgi:purine nucleosidase
LTNVALAVARRPEIASKVARCVLMGGNPCCEGNVTPAAEYNIWCDPEAAVMVLRSGMPVDLVGWHLCRGEAVLGAGDIAQVLSFSTPLARFAIECNSTAMDAYRRQTGETGISLPDPVAMSIALDRSVCMSRSRHAVRIETASVMTRGMTVVDRLNVAADNRNREVWMDAPHADICWALDVPRWKQSLYTALK